LTLGGTVSEVRQDRAARPATPRPPLSPGARGTTEPINLADLLERVLDKGIVIAGDVKLIIGDIELLTIKIRLLIASVDKAQEIGINWWESDPALSSQNRELRKQRDELSKRLDRIEASIPGLENDPEYPWEGAPALSAQNRELRKQRDELQERLNELEARFLELQERTDEKEESRGRRRRRES
jgi:hypothetical protein